MCLVKWAFGMAKVDGITREKRLVERDNLIRGLLSRLLTKS